MGSTSTPSSCWTWTPTETQIGVDPKETARGYCDSAEVGPRRRDARTTEGVGGWTISGSEPDDDAVLADTTDLLRAELPDPRLVDDTAYLRWSYRENPSGPAWERYHYIEDPDSGPPLLVAHYVISARRFRGPEGRQCEGALSQHSVTRSGYQRAGHFTRLGLETYAEAGDAGRDFVAGVANEMSTPAFIKYLDWRLAGPLPVRVIPPLGRGRRDLSHAEVSANWLENGGFDDLAAAVDRHPVAAWSTDWTAETLRWRLACPFARYWVHANDDLALVTTRTIYKKLPATVVLKIFPLSPGPVPATKAIRSAALWHRSAFAVYAGFNPAVTVRGIKPPRRLQPSPLNLIVRSLNPALDNNGIDFDTFELLDMDAY